MSTRRNGNKKPDGKGSVKGEIPCPFCGKSKMIVYENTMGGGSLQCSNCGHFYIVDFDLMQGKRSSAIKSERLQSGDIRK